MRSFVEPRIFLALALMTMLPSGHLTVAAEGDLLASAHGENCRAMILFHEVAFYLGRLRCRW